MDYKTLENIIDKSVAYNKKIVPPGYPLEILWHGGEPLLGGVDFFKKIIHYEEKYPYIRFTNKLQTNGVLMTEEMADFLTSHHFQVGFSLDGPEETHNTHRLLRGGKKGAFQHTMRGIENYRKYSKGHYIPVIAVITRHTIERGAREFYEFFKKLRASVQMDPYDITCYDLLKEGFSIKESPFIPDPAEFGNFVVDLFNMWFYDDPDIIEFRDLKNEIKLLLSPQARTKKIPDKRRCSLGRTIIDPLGRVFSCDQYVNNDHTSLGNINEDPLEIIMERKFKLWEDIKTFFRKNNNPYECNLCQYGDMCHGGCITCMKYNYFTLNGYDLNEHSKEKAGDWLEKYFRHTGDSMYCSSYKIYREHIKKCVAEEMNSGNP